MNDTIVRVMDLPVHVGGTVIEDENGDFNVTINARYGYNGQREAYRHEMRHIEDNDLRNDRDIQAVESQSSK